MICKCYSLEKINIANLKANNNASMCCMFDGIDKKVINKIKSLKKFKKEAFE